MTETSNKEQKVEAKTPSGIPIEITLEEWVSIVIETALKKHKVSCPLTDEKILNRIEVLELKLKIVQWVGAVVTATVVGQVVLAIING